MEKWNNRYVSSPPMYYYNKQDHNVKTVTISRMSTCVSNLEDQLAHQGTLAEENFYLLRILYKLKNQQRHEKTFAYLQLIKKCIQRYLDVDFGSLLNALSTDLQRPILDPSDILNYLPSQQTLQYYMVKLMGGAGLLAQIMMYCNLVLVPIRQQMNQVHFMDKNLLFMGIVSRIWVMSKLLLCFIQNGYNQMFLLLHKFPANPLPWLTEDESLPADLGEWLITNWPSLHATLPRFDKSELDVKCNTPAENEDAENEDEMELTPLTKSSSVFSPDEDVGVPIEYHQSTPIDAKRQKTPKNTVSLKFGYIRGKTKACKTSVEYVSLMEFVQLALKFWPKTIIPNEFHEFLQLLVLEAQEHNADHKTKILGRVIRKTIRAIKKLKILPTTNFKLSPKKTKFIFQLLNRCVQDNKKLKKCLKSLELLNVLHLGPVLVTLSKKKVDKIVPRLKQILRKKELYQQFKDEEAVYML